MVKNHQAEKISTLRAKTAAQLFPAADPFGRDAALGFDRAGQRLQVHRVCGCPRSDPVGVANVSGGLPTCSTGLSLWHSQKKGCSLGARANSLAKLPCVLQS